MELVAVLVIPVLASFLSLLPLGRRFAAPITLGANIAVLVLAARVAAEATRTGRVDAFDEWLTCDGLGALVLLLVAFVGLTASLFSWGYIRRRAEHKARGKSKTTTGSTTYSCCRCSPCRCWQMSR